MQLTKAASLTSTDQRERGTIQVYNNQGAVIPQYSPVCWDVTATSAAGQGEYVKLPVTANLQLFAGIAQDTIGTGSRGTIVIYGHSKVKAWGIAAWDAALQASCVDGETYVVFGTSADQVGQMHSFAENSSAATTTIDVFVKAM